MELNAPVSPERAHPSQLQTRGAQGGAEGLDSTPSSPRTSSVELPPPGAVDLPEREFRVGWEIDLYAGSPVAAAQKALGIHRNPESTADVFKVTDRARPEDGSHLVDLSELDELGQPFVELQPAEGPVRPGATIAIPDCGRPTKPGTYLWGAWGQATEIVNIEERAGELWQTSCGISSDARLSEFSDKGAWFGPIDLDQPGTGLRSPRVEPAPALPAVVPSSGEPAAEVGLVSALAARCRKVYDDALPGSPELQWEGYDWAVVELFQRIKETGIAEPLILLEKLKGDGQALNRYKAGENLLGHVHRAMDDLAGAAIHDVLKPFKEDPSLDFAGVRFVRGTWENDDRTVVEIARVQVGYAGTGEGPIEWVDWADAPGFMEDDDARHQLAMLGLHFVDYHTETYEVMV